MTYALLDEKRGDCAGEIRTDGDIATSDEAELPRRLFGCLRLLFIVLRYICVFSGTLSCLFGGRVRSLFQGGVCYCMPHFFVTFTIRKTMKATITKVIKATRKSPTPNT